MTIEQAIERVANQIQYIRSRLIRMEGQGYQDAIADVQAMEKLIGEVRKLQEKNRA